MPATVAPLVLDRINSLVASAPYSFTQAREPFSFDLQPNTNVHQCYAVEMTLARGDGYLGYNQAELHRVTIWLARLAQSAPHTAQRALITDISSLVASLTREGEIVDFNADFDEAESEVRHPSDTDPYLIGRLAFVVDFDRAL